MKKPTAVARPDVLVHGGLGFYTFELLSKRARLWTHRCVARAVWNGTTAEFHCDDRQYAEDIADAMQADGLVVR